MEILITAQEIQNKILKMAGSKKDVTFKIKESLANNICSPLEMSSKEFIKNKSIWKKLPEYVIMKEIDNIPYESGCGNFQIACQSAAYNLLKKAAQEYLKNIEVKLKCK